VEPLRIGHGPTDYYAEGNITTRYGGLNLYALGGIGPYRWAVKPHDSHDDFEFGVKVIVPWGSPPQPFFVTTGSVVGFNPFNSYEQNSYEQVELYLTKEPSDGQLHWNVIDIVLMDSRVPLDADPWYSDVWGEHGNEWITGGNLWIAVGDPKYIPRG